MDIDDESVPDDASVDVSVTESTINKEHTATVSILFENSGEEPITITAGREFPFSPKESENHRWALMYDPDEPRKVSPECWELADEFALSREMVSERYTLDPGEQVSGRRWLWSHPDAETCMPTGKTTFSTSATIVEENGPDREFVWGFSLRIESI